MERGVHSPRRIASAKRAAVSRSAAGLRLHKVSHALVLQIGSEQLIEMMVRDRIRGRRKAEQIIHRCGDLERALIAVAHHARDPFRIGGAAAHDAGDFVGERPRQRRFRPRGIDVRNARRAALQRLHRRRKAAHELVIIVGIQNIVLAVVLGLRHQIECP